MPAITPCLWFDDQAEPAARFYVSVFPNSRITNITHYGDAGPRPKGTVLMVEFELDGQKFTALNGGPQYQFNSAVSFMVPCQNQVEIDAYWAKLCDGGKEIQCGWLTDRFGLAWQVYPVQIATLFSDKTPAKAAAAMQAMFAMKKLDLAALQKAYDAA